MSAVAGVVFAVAAAEGAACFFGEALHWEGVGLRG